MAPYEEIPGDRPSRKRAILLGLCCAAAIFAAAATRSLRLSPRSLHPVLADVPSVTAAQCATGVSVYDECVDASATIGGTTLSCAVAAEFAYDQLCSDVYSVSQDEVDIITLLADSYSKCDLAALVLADCWTGTSTCSSYYDSIVSFVDEVGGCDV